MSDKEKVGFIAVYRKIQDHWIWTDPDRLRAWLDIIISAQFHDSELMTRGVKITVPIGSWFVSVKTLEKRWGWSRGKILRFFRLLSADGMLNTKRTQNGYLLTVINYGVYQKGGYPNNHSDSNTDKQPNSNSDGNSGSNSDGKHTNNYNKGNKVTKKKTVDFSKYTFSEEEMASMPDDDEEYWKEAWRRKAEGLI